MLVSARHTWAVYKLDYATGQVIWRLGGKKSDFAIDDAGKFAWQHDAVALAPDTLSIFNNDAGTKKVRPYSTVLTLKLDPQAHTATTDAVAAPPARAVQRHAGQRAGAGRRRRVRGLGVAGAGSPSSTRGQGRLRRPGPARL